MFFCHCGLPRKAEYFVELKLQREVNGKVEKMNTGHYVCDDHLDDSLVLSGALKSQGWFIVETEVVCHH